MCYVIDASGSLLGVDVVDSNEADGGGASYAKDVINVLRRSSPFLPPPAGVHQVIITELFWQSAEAELATGSLAQELSLLQGGRRMKAGDP
ncbi:MAG: hypothetical protein JO277_06625 [Candidatus Eremiobacteraeota bacterium]|nr:hypothetical protein [Candidatus Eremiobacteraeota bacterium]